MDLREYIDSHNHTKHFSIDGFQTLDELVQSALEADLGGLVLTEHYDKDMIHKHIHQGITPVGSPAEPDEWIFDIDAYFAFIQEKQMELAISRPGFRLLTGIELGYLDYLAKDLDALSSSYPFDSIVGSVHSLDLRDMYFYPEYYEQPKKQAYGKYLETLIHMIKNMENFDIMAHFDYVERNANYDDNKLHYADFPDHFDEIFRLLIYKGKSLEINTRSRYRAIDAGDPDPGLPDADILRRYIELGGELITISSDSHAPGQCGRMIADTAEWLQSLGVRYLCSFRNRKPVMTRI